MTNPTEFSIDPKTGLYPDETPNIVDDIRKTFGKTADAWMNAGNLFPQGSGKAIARPKDLIGTPREPLVRQRLREIRAADYI